MKILIVEDNQELLNNILSYFKGEGALCESAVNFKDASEKLWNYQYDILLLDLTLPDGDGLDLLPEIKRKNTEMGILILSAKNALDDKIKGLDFGADDYLTKPFHLSELNARVKALYRRKKLQGDNTIIFNEININTTTLEVRVQDNLLTLTKKEYELLLFLISNPNRVLSKQTIAEHLWGDYMDVQDSYEFVYQHIKNLRKKLQKAGGNDYLNTVYGMGYRFNAASE